MYINSLSLLWVSLKDGFESYSESPVLPKYRFFNMFYLFFNFFILFYFYARKAWSNQVLGIALNPSQRWLRIFLSELRWRQNYDFVTYKQIIFFIEFCCFFVIFDFFLWKNYLYQVYEIALSRTQKMASNPSQGAQWCQNYDFFVRIVFYCRLFFPFFLNI